MYCVKCGVKLEDNPERCPLCGTPVWNPDGAVGARPRFSEEMPPAGRSAGKVLAVILTAITAVAAFTVFVISQKLPGSSSWSGYALLGIALGFIVCVLPLWFKRYVPEIFVPVSHLAAGGYLLYVCLRSGGNWFLPFAMPLTLISCALLTALTVLMSRVKQRQGLILGGFIVACGLFSMLVELFAHITFGLKMFAWSLYSLCACAAVGGLILLVELIPPLRSFFKRNFFY